MLVKFNCIVLLIFCSLSIKAQVLNKDFELKSWKDIDFKKYGFKVNQNKTHNKITTIIKDFLAKEYTVLIYDRKYNTQMISHYTNLNELISSETRIENQLTFIYNQANPPLKVIQTFNKEGGYLKEVFQKQINKNWKKISQNNFGPEASMECNEAMSIGAWNRRLQNFTDDNQHFLDFELRSRQGNSVEIGNNTRIKDCQEIQPDGEAGIIEDLESAFDTGMSCIETIYQSYKNANNSDVARRAAEIRRLGRRAMGNFIEGANNKFTIECNNPIPGYNEPGGREAREEDPENHIGVGTMAFASTCEGYFEDESIVPGMQLNARSYSAQQNNPRKRRSTLFHEMLHHAGIYHDGAEGSVDWVYKMQFCCFGLDENIPATDELPSSFTCRTILAADHGQPSPDVSSVLDVVNLED